MTSQFSLLVEHLVPTDNIILVLLLHSNVI